MVPIPKGLAEVINFQGITVQIPGIKKGPLWLSDDVELDNVNKIRMLEYSLLNL